MSIVAGLASQSLIYQKNNLQYALLRNSSTRYSMLNSLNFGANMNYLNQQETALNLQDISNSVCLGAISAELNSLNYYV